MLFWEAIREVVLNGRVATRPPWRERFIFQVETAQLFPRDPTIQPKGGGKPQPFLCQGKGSGVEVQYTPWSPTQEDMRAIDWELLDAKAVREKN